MLEVWTKQRVFITECFRPAALPVLPGCFQHCPSLSRACSGRWRGTTARGDSAPSTQVAQREQKTDGRNRPESVPSRPVGPAGRYLRALQVRSSPCDAFNAVPSRLASCLSATAALQPPARCPGEKSYQAINPKGGKEHEGCTSPWFFFFMGIDTSDRPRLLNRSYYLNTCSSNPGKDCYWREAVKMVNGANK